MPANTEKELMRARAAVYELVKRKENKKREINIDRLYWEITTKYAISDNSFEILIKRLANAGYIAVNGNTFSIQGVE